MSLVNTGYRTNVWDYAGVNTMKAGRADELAIALRVPERPVEIEPAAAVSD